MKTRVILNQIKESMCESYNKGQMSGTVNISGFDEQFIKTFMANEKEISHIRGFNFDFKIEEGFLEYKFLNKGEQKIGYLELISDDDELILNQIHELIATKKVDEEGNILVSVAGVNADRIKTVLFNNPKIKDCIFEDTQLRILVHKQEKEGADPKKEGSKKLFFSFVLGCVFFIVVTALIINLKSFL